MLQIPYKELLTAADKKPDDRQRAAKKLLVGDRFVSDFSREGRFDWYERTAKTHKGSDIDILTYE